MLWVVGVVLVLLFLVSLLAGPIVKSYINAHGEELTGRKVEVDHVGVNLFSGNVNVRGLSVYEDDGERRFAGFDTLDVRMHLLKLPFKTLQFSHITLAGFKATVQQEGERFNFSSLIEHFATADSTEEKDTTPSGWVMKFYNIRLAHGSLRYDDLVNRKSLSLPDVNLRVPGFVLGGEESSEGGLNIGFDRGGRLNVDALYDTQGSSYRLDVGLDDFALENLDAYLADMVDYDRIKGTVSAALSVGGSTRELLKSSIKGDMAVKGAVLEAGGGVVAGFDTLRVKVADISLDDNRFDLSEVRLSGMQAHYEQWDGISNIDRLLRKAEREAVTMQTGVGGATADTVSAVQTAAAKPMQLHIGSLRVVGGSATYSDHTLPDEFHFPVTGIDIRADNLTTAGGNNAGVKATLPGGGRLVVRWNGDLADWKRSQDLFFTVKGLDMKLLSPWAVAYTGQPIEDGIFGLTTRLNIRNSELDNQNKIDIYKAKVGSRRKDVEPEMKIPLKAALYVLKDKDDKILIDLPVKGNVDSPEFSYMKLVWKTLGNLLVKVATSPARAIGNALGLGGDEMEFIAVSQQQHGLTSEQYHVLSGLAAVAAADSLVSLTLELQVPADDTVGHRHEMLNRQVADYLKEQGLDESRFRVTTAVAEAGKPMGYAIGSELKIEE